MGVAISSTLLARLLNEAAGSPDCEVCGLLFGTVQHVVGASACTNVAADPARRFEIDPAALLRAHRAARQGGLRIAGCYHSHPSGVAEPSACDAAAAMGDGALWLILAGGEARLWRTVRQGAFEEVDLIVGMAL